MLPMKQQLKLAGELMGAKTGLDAFEKTMQKWSSGEVTDFSELFGHESKKQVKKDETGQSSELKSARETASSQLEKFALAEWDAYVAEFKTFYGLDAPQQATVDSILREFKERAQTRKRDAAWQARYYRNRLWLNIFWRVPDSWNHPVQVLVQDDQDEATSWLDELSRDLKARLDSVPTRSQQEQADARVDSLLKEKGIEITEATP